MLWIGLVKLVSLELLTCTAAKNAFLAHNCIFSVSWSAKIIFVRHSLFDIHRFIENTSDTKSLYRQSYSHTLNMPYADINGG